MWVNSEIHKNVEIRGNNKPYSVLKDEQELDIVAFNKVLINASDKFWDTRKKNGSRVTPEKFRWKERNEEEIKPGKIATTERSSSNIVGTRNKIKYNEWLGKIRVVEREIIKNTNK